MADKPKIGANRGNAGKGRPKGAKNKITAAVKDMVTQALDEAGGVQYLIAQSRDNPTAFLTLVGKVIPLQGDMNHSVTVGRLIYPGLDD